MYIYVYIYIYIYKLYAGGRASRWQGKRPEDGSQNPAPDLSHR